MEYPYLASFGFNAYQKLNTMCCVISIMFPSEDDSKTKPNLLIHNEHEWNLAKLLLSD